MASGTTVSKKIRKKKYQTIQKSVPRQSHTESDR
jgi:hypothetical protein